jgi:hypothetical protein
MPPTSWGLAAGFVAAGVVAAVSATAAGVAATLAAANMVATVNPSLVDSFTLILSLLDNGFSAGHLPGGL